MSEKWQRVRDPGGAGGWGVSMGRGVEMEAWGCKDGGAELQLNGAGDFRGSGVRDWESRNAAKQG